MSSSDHTATAGFRAIGGLLPFLPALPDLPPPARAKVRRGSTTDEVTFRPLAKTRKAAKEAATRIYHRARDFDRQTKRKGKHGGAIGPVALDVLEVLLFDFLNPVTGQLDPSLESIGRKANKCVSAVVDALERLSQLKIIGWIRRCVSSWQDGRHVLEQRTNAYEVHPETEWPRYRAPADPPPPAPGTWGEPARVPSAIEQAAAEPDPRLKIEALDLAPYEHGSPDGRMAAALARLGRRIAESEADKAGKP